MAFWKKKEYGDIHREYDSAKNRLAKDIAYLDRMTASKIVDINAYRRQQAAVTVHYQNLIDVVEQLQDRLEAAKPEEKERIRKDLKYFVGSLNELGVKYGKLLKDAKDKGIRFGLKELKQEEQNLAREEEGLEERLGNTAAIFLLASASGSFGYALANTISNTNNITGATIGLIVSANAPSLLLSTLALILIILLVSPSDGLEGLFKKKKR